MNQKFEDTLMHEVLKDIKMQRKAMAECSMYNRAMRLPWGWCYIGIILFIGGTLALVIDFFHQSYSQTKYKDD